MDSWRDLILRDFTPQVSRLTLVADPDGLLLEEGVLAGIRERGFELIPFEDPIEFRYAYESKFRTEWDKGQQTDLVVVLRTASNELDSLPYDLLQAGRKLHFSLGDIFPNLNYPVVNSLNAEDLDLLYKAQQLYAPGTLSENATKEFILLHVFEIAPELIKKPKDLLRVLIRKHYQGRVIPETIDNRLVQLLKMNKIFEDWPLEFIIPDRLSFFRFLQERWPVFLDRMSIEGQPQVRENDIVYGFEFKGPKHLPFEHDDIRIYIDNLFVEGILKPTEHYPANRFKNTWISLGIKTDPEGDRLKRLVGLLKVVNSTMPVEDSRHTEWLQYAYKLGELTCLEIKAWQSISENLKEELIQTHQGINQRFQLWIQKRYAGLVNLPPSPPVMLHHIPRYFSRMLAATNDNKIAFLLVDGLSIDQWIVVRDTLQAQVSDLIFKESSVFSWIPTLTSVARQAAFAGKPPMYFPNSIFTTHKEAAFWKQFWIDQGLAPQEIAYSKNIENTYPESVINDIENPKLKVIGLVINKVDKIMHGMELGQAGMHNQVKQWIEQGFLKDLIGSLLEKQFEVFLSSDHGNVEAEGIGRISEGSVADLKGSRVRIFADEALRSNIHIQYPDTIPWIPIGLPDHFLPLIATNKSAFINNGEHTICHGGISIEETIVPFVSIEKK